MKSKDELLSDMMKFYFEQNKKQTNPATEYEVQEQVLADYKVLQETVNSKEE